MGELSQVLRKTTQRGKFSRAENRRDFVVLPRRPSGLYAFDVAVREEIGRADAGGTVASGELYKIG